MCRVLKVSRTGYLQWRVRPPSGRSEANAGLDTQVATIHAEHQRRYGRVQIVRQRHAQGQRVGAERVRKSLCRQGLRAVYRRRYRVTTDSEHTRTVAPNILSRRLEGWAPNRAWVSDITYVWTMEGWLYLACVLDLRSRRIVGE